MEETILVKKIKDQSGNVYVLKKPFYKRFWFWILLLFLIVCGVALSGGETEKSSSNNQTATTTSTKSSASKNIGQKLKDVAKDAVTFEPKDSSDKTIESIKTYGDYITMYSFIVNEYITNYENAVAQYGLAETTTYQAMRDQSTKNLEDTKKQYGPMKHAPIVGKKEIVQFLKDYRDELKTFTDSLANGA